MSTISIRLTDEQTAELKARANNAKDTVSAYIINQLFGGTIQNSNHLTIEIILKRIESRKNSGDKFNISELFDDAEWSNFTNTVSIGRIFRIKSKEENNAVSEMVDFVEKESGELAVYQKK